ncbi:MAG: type III PLP-dependent enzyme [Alphaproteobacteria bacterium]|jgi:ornithine decarboxylase|nr:type III PLP-dependent enzyme [Alphaproteobacteria bacterium]
MINARVQRFLEENSNRIQTPCVIFDLNVLKEKYADFKKNMPNIEVFYAVKCNPSPKIIETLRDLGSSFDVASIEEVELCLSLKVDPAKLSWGSTIKKPYLVKKAYEWGVRLFATDSIEDLHGIAENAPGSKVYCRILVNNKNALWPLSAKFGCSLSMAEHILVQAKELGLQPFGISFHVGSQQLDLEAWDRAITNAARVFYELKESYNIELEMLNLGGGYPSYGYLTDYQPIEDYYKVIHDSLNENFGDNHPSLFAEPGRFLVADAGTLITEVVLVSKKSHDTDLRWVYLDVGLYGGLAETLGESIKYNIITSKDSDEVDLGEVNIAGPTCDGMDIMYKDYKYNMPIDLQAGDMVYILSTGAYTTSYSSVNFNGFKPLKDYFIE